MKEIVYGIGIAGSVGCDETITLREGHPTAHPGFQLRITSDDNVVTAANLTIGFMHRGVEKLFESRDYRQAMMLANRHDWLSAFHSELLIALLLEDTMGILPPPRATWIRMLVAEANRAAASLAFLAPMLDGHDRQQLVDARESLITAQEMATGARMHPMYARIGGVAHGLDASSLDAYEQAVVFVRTAWDSTTGAREEMIDRQRGLAILTHADAVANGASGAVGHASGVNMDLRRSNLFYAEVDDLLPRNPSGPFTGDAAERYRSLAAQIPSSLAIMDAALQRLQTMIDDPYDVVLPKTVRAPEGMTSMSIDGPLGMMGALLVSDGDRMPWRLKLRTASYNNAQAMQAALVGTPVNRLADAVMSFSLVVGDIDR